MHDRHDRTVGPSASECSLKRAPRREQPMMTPSRVAGEPGMVTVDATWGRIAPMAIAPGVLTVGELEVIEHLRAGGTAIDTRLEHFCRSGTIPGATNVPHTRIVEAVEEIERASPAVLFCNGPQCPATPDAILALLRAGVPASSLLYYRGGIHDWVTLGLPLRTPDATG